MQALYLHVVSWDKHFVYLIAFNLMGVQVAKQTYTSYISVACCLLYCRGQVWSLTGAATIIFSPSFLVKCCFYFFTKCYCYQCSRSKEIFHFFQWHVLVMILLIFTKNKHINTIDMPNVTRTESSILLFCSSKIMRDTLFLLQETFF